MLDPRPLAALDGHSRGRDTELVCDQLDDGFIGSPVSGDGTDSDAQDAALVSAIDLIDGCARRDVDAESSRAGQRRRSTRIRIRRAMMRIIGARSIIPVEGKTRRMGDSSGSVVS